MHVKDQVLNLWVVEIEIFLILFQEKKIFRPTRWDKILKICSRNWLERYIWTHCTVKLRYYLQNLQLTQLRTDSHVLKNPKFDWWHWHICFGRYLTHIRYTLRVSSKLGWRVSVVNSLSVSSNVTWLYFYSNVTNPHL